MIYFDVTKTATIRHRSGLARLSERLRDEMGAAATSCAWAEIAERASATEWFVTTELFWEAERPGFLAFLRSRKCRTAAIFADAIPLKFPHITWPQSVARHPGYMKMLAEFEHVWAISEASRNELAGYWAWLGLLKTPKIEVLPLGADFDRSPRIVGTAAASNEPALLCVGILEPRKNQMFLLDVCEDLWREGLRFDLHIVGRVNPHFGKPIVARIAALRRRHRGLHHHESASDALLAALYGGARATVCPTLAEGCGLPLLESLWRGVPCVCSDLPVLQENAGGGGCVAVRLNDRAAWHDALGKILTDVAHCGQLANEAKSRPLSVWADCARQLQANLAR
jgi:glycosyltransferase involved in cell wall biosynthesis